jgi:hypothetical protein
LPLPDNTAVCTTVLITGAFYPSPEPRPALVFEFTHEDGTVLAPIVLVLDEHVIQQVPVFAHVETHKAIAKSRAVRALS